MVLDLVKYRASKIVTEDLSVVLPAIDLAYKTLLPFQRYRSVWNVLKVLAEERTFIKSQLEKYETIKNNKGRIE